MSETENRLVIAGAGQAGAWVAATVRELQPDREIVLVGDEPYPPYERPPLSKAVLMGADTPESTHIKPADFYVEAGIDLRLGTSVQSIDPAAREVRLSDGTALDYGALVIATGMRARRLDVPGAGHRKVVALRGLEDLDAVRAGFGADRHIVLIGAGFIGLEIAAAARQSDTEVTVVEAAPSALGRILAPEVANALVARHRDHGVAFRFSDSVTEITDRDGRPELRFRKGERMVADLVVVGIGGVPNDDIARAAGLDCDDGIVVDAAGRTSAPGIFAVGDVCRQFHPLLGRHVQLQSWQNAQNGGIALGKHLAGAAPDPAGPPWFWTDQYGDNFQIVGLPETWDRILWRGAPDADKFTVFYLKGSRVVAGNALNAPRDVRPITQMIRDGITLSDAALIDTSQSLVKLLKAQDAA